MAPSSASAPGITGDIRRGSGIAAGTVGLAGAIVADTLARDTRVDTLAATLAAASTVGTLSMAEAVFTVEVVASTAADFTEVVDTGKTLARMKR
jgi:hypothetical protein